MSNIYGFTDASGATTSNDSELDGYVTLATDQVITGAKTFTATVETEDLNVTGTIQVAGASTFNNTIQVAGASTFNSTIQVANMITSNATSGPLRQINTSYLNFGGTTSGAPDYSGVKIGRIYGDLGAMIFSSPSSVGQGQYIFYGQSVGGPMISLLYMNPLTGLTTDTPMPPVSDSSTTIPTTAWVQGAIKNTLLSFKRYVKPPNTQSTGNINVGTDTGNMKVMDSFTLTNLVYGQYVKVVYMFTMDFFNGINSPGFTAELNFSGAQLFNSDIEAESQILSSDNFTQSGQYYSTLRSGSAGGLNAFARPSTITNYSQVSGTWTSTRMMTYEFVYQYILSSPTQTIYLNFKLISCQGQLFNDQVNFSFSRYVASC